MRTFGTLLAACAFLCAANAFADDKPVPVQSFGGAAFGNWHYINNGANPSTGFDLSLAEMAYDVAYGEHFKAEIKMEADRVEPVTGFSVDTAANVTLTKSERYFVGVKRAFFVVKNIIPVTEIGFGLLELSQNGFPEGLWGYRYVYKTLLDQYGYGENDDYGITAKVSPVKQLAISAAFVNGDGRKNLHSTEGSYKGSAAIDLTLDNGIMGHVYGDLRPFESGNKQVSFSGCLGFKREAFRIGADYDWQNNCGGVTDATKNGVSAYASVQPAKVMNVFARGDFFSTDKWKTAEKVMMGGLSFSFFDHLQISPNLQYKIPPNSPNVTSIYLNTRLDI